MSNSAANSSTPKTIPSLEQLAELFMQWRWYREEFLRLKAENQTLRAQIKRLRCES